MPIKLDIVNDKVVVSASMKVIPELDKIITLPDKNKSNKYLLYIYFTSSYDENNPYRDMPEAGKEKESIHRAFEDSKKTELTKEEAWIIMPAKAAYIKFTETADERIVTSITTKLDQLKELLDANEPEIIRWYNETTGETRFATNSDILTKIMNSIDGLIEKREKIKGMLLNQSSSGRVRGGYSSSAIEKGHFKNISKEKLN